MNWDTVQVRVAVILGLLGGIAGGIGMAMWMMIKAATAGQGFWAPVSMCLASFVYRGWARRMMDQMMMLQQQGQMMQPGFEGIHGLVGIVLHMAVSMLFGVVFALILSGGLGRRLGAAGTVAAGIVYGAAIWLVMEFAILPIINSFMVDNIKDMVGSWVFFVAHLLFGMILGAIVGWQYRTRSSQARSVHVA